MGNREFWEGRVGIEGGLLVVFAGCIRGDRDVY